MEAAATVYSRILSPDAASPTDSYIADLQKAMLDATPDCIKVLSVEGNLLTMNRAGCLALNVPQDSGFGMPWLSLLPAEVHADGRYALSKAALGETVRFLGNSVSAGGPVYWDNLLTPLIDSQGRVLSILCVSRDVTEKVQLEKELGEALNREKLIALEMHHRIKNIFAVISGLILISEKEANSEPSANQVVQILRAKIKALSRASDVVFTKKNNSAETEGLTDLVDVSRAVLWPYGERCLVDGEQILVAQDRVSVFALLLHELATNSVKYGALSKDNGNVTISWALNKHTVLFSWLEKGGPKISTEPECRGFGTEMVNRTVQSLKGRIDRKWDEEGLTVNIRFPHLKE
ncbi:sensor histidine kinase [Acetobacter persici]|uniref:sensor histidine kinase n=1 Tax=Acetobacter persici TaxID=1076596 RepID=UPI0039E86BB0